MHFDKNLENVCPFLAVGTGGTEGTYPQDLEKTKKCPFILRNCSVSSRKKVPCPKFEMLLAAMSVPLRLLLMRIKPGLPVCSAK